MQSAFRLSAQDNDKKLFDFEFHGFIKSDYWYDTRNNLNAREGLFSLYPLQAELDQNGIDINKTGSFNFSAITSRTNVTVKGPDAFGAKTKAFIEADFSGMSNVDINGFRLRHAYLKLKWEKASILFGQYWHPLFTTDVFPTIVSLNTGAPFQQFNRSPQVRFDYTAGKFTFTAAALSQRDYMHYGPGESMASPVYLHQAGLPDVFAGIQLNSGKHTAGIGADFKRLRPMMVNAMNTVNKEFVNSESLIAYYKYKTDMFQLKAKATVGKNMTDQLMLGGYGISSIDTITGITTFAPSSNMAFWVNAVYGKKVKVGIFAGYTENLGFDEEMRGEFYMRGKDIISVYRVAPQISFVSGKAHICYELEVTTATYGELNNSGAFDPTISKNYTNFRNLITIFYFF